MQIYSTQTGMDADAKAVIKDIKLVDNRESGLLFGDSRTDFCRKNCGCACMGGCAYRRRIDFWNIIDILNGCAQKGNLKNVKRYPDVVIALNYINENFMDTINIKTLAEKSYVSVSTLERHFLTVFGMSPIQYVRQQRIMHAAELLKSGERITDVAMKCGFNDYSRFIAMFKQHYGITPLRYQKVNLDLNVRETL